MVNNCFLLNINQQRLFQENFVQKIIHKNKSLFYSGNGWSINFNQSSATAIGSPILSNRSALT